MTLGKWIGMTAVLVTLCSIGRAQAQLIRQKKVGAYPIYTVENSYYRLRISPKEGGRILSFFDKRSRTELTVDGGPGQDGGLLDDRKKFTVAPYGSSIMHQDAHEAVLRLWFNTSKDPQGQAVVKYLTFFADRPVIELRYEFSNGSQKQAPLWIRNFLQMPGGIEKGRTHFNLSTENGWQSLYAANYYRRLSTPWYAVLDQPTQSGLAFLADRSSIDAFYFYHKGEIATMEWINRPVPPGYKTSNYGTLILLDGLNRVTLLSKRCAAGIAPEITPDGEVRLTGRVISLDPSLKKATLSAQASDTQGGVVHQWKEITVDLNAPDGQPVSATFTPIALPPGGYIIKIHVVGDKGFKADSAPIVLHTDGDKGPIAVKTLPETKRKLTAIAGWKSDADRFAITDADKHNGFWLSRGRDEGKTRLDKIQLNDVLGANETDAINFGVNSLKELKDLPLGMEIDDKALASHVHFFQEDDYKLNPLSHLDMSAGAEKRLWLLIDSSGLTPGIHQSHLRLKIGSTIAVLPLKVEVFPVPLPEKRYLWIKGYVLAKTFSDGYELDQSAMQRVARTVPLYTQMGGSVVSWWPQTLSGVRIKGSDEWLLAAAKKKPFALDNLPDLDFSYFIPFWKTFLDRGAKQFDVTLYLYPSQRDMRPLISAVLGRKSDVKPGTPQADRLLVWYLTQFRRAIQEAGFTRIFCKIGDEISPDQIPAYIQTAKLARQAGIRPYTTITGEIPRIPRLIRQINPYLDLWQLSFASKDIFLDLIRKPYRVKSKKVELSGHWRTYVNGSATHTWAQSFFGTQTSEGLSDVVGFELLENGKPLTQKPGSPWGNQERGVCYISGATLYISPKDGTPEGKHYTAVMKIRVSDPNGRPLVKIDPSDDIWIYGGGTSPFKTPHDQFRRYGWVAAADNLQGLGIWAYWWGQPTERIVFYNAKTNVTTLTPAYWGVRDGWEEGQYLSKAMEGMSAGRRKEFLKGIISTDPQASLHLTAASHQIYHYLTVGNAGDPQAWIDAKRKVLKYLSH